MEINTMDVEEAEGGIESVSIFMDIYELCELERDLRKTRVKELTTFRQTINQYLDKNNIVKFP